MKYLGSIVVLLTVLQITVPQRAVAQRPSGLNTDVSSFMRHHSRPFLDRMKTHFDKSLDYLFTSYAFSGQSVQRPGMAGLLKEQSERHWQEGIDALKKYVQRGGHTYYDGTGSPPDNSQEKHFDNSFKFTGSNTLNSISKGSTDFSGTYLKQLDTLVSDSRDSAKIINKLHSDAMRHGSHDDIRHDADIGHYLEEKLENEIKITRKFSNLYTSLAQMKDLGMAVHFFDQSLL